MICHQYGDVRRKGIIWRNSNQLQVNLKRNTEYFILANASDSVFCKLLAIFFQRKVLIDVPVLYHFCTTAYISNSRLNAITLHGKANSHYECYFLNYVHVTYGDKSSRENKADLCI